MKGYLQTVQRMGEDFQRCTQCVSLSRRGRLRLGNFPVAAVRRTDGAPALGFVNNGHEDL